MRVFLVRMLVLSTLGCRDAATDERLKRLEDRVAALERRSSSTYTSAATVPPSQAAASPTSAQPVVQAPSGVPGQDPAAAEPVIIPHCTEKWPSDVETRAYCQKQQREAVAKLNQPPPADVPADVAALVRSKCAEEWPMDCEMREYCEEQQLEGYRDPNR